MQIRDLHIDRQFYYDFAKSTGILDRVYVNTNHRRNHQFPRRKCARFDCSCLEGFKQIAIPSLRKYCEFGKETGLRPFHSRKLKIATISPRHNLSATGRAFDRSPSGDRIGFTHRQKRKTIFDWRAPIFEHDLFTQGRERDESATGRLVNKNDF